MAYLHICILYGCHLRSILVIRLNEVLLIFGQLFLQAVIFGSSCRAGTSWMFCMDLTVRRQPSGVAGGGLPPGRNSAHPLAPNEITLCTEVYGEPPFWGPVSPPPLTPEPPLPPPHFERSGYAPAATSVKHLSIYLYSKYLSTFPIVDR